MNGLVGGPPQPWLGVLLVLAAAAPWHRAALVRPPGRRAVVTGLLLATACLAAVAVGAVPARRLLGTSDPALRTAAGLVVILAAAAQALRPRPRRVDLRGRGGALGLAFPVLLRPEAILAVSSLSVDHGAVAAIVTATAALALTGAVLLVGHPARGPVAPGRIDVDSTPRSADPPAPRQPHHDETVRVWATASVAVGVLAVFSGVLSV